MARLAPRLAAAALTFALCAAVGGVVHAQTLQKVHVRAFALASDRETLAIGEQARVTITIRVDEALDTLDNVTLPDFYGFQILADERSLRSAPGGTTYVETITLAPTETGVRRIGPVTLEAIDANTKRPSRFGSNTIEIRVVAAPAPVSPVWAKVVEALFWIAVLSLGLFIFLRFRKPQLSRLRRMQPEAAIVPAASDPLPSEAERWRALVEALADHPSRENVVAVRTLLRQQAGARDDETFGDILARATTRLKPEFLEAMRAVERAAFIDDAHLTSAVREAVAALQRYARVVGS